MNSIANIPKRLSQRDPAWAGVRLGRSVESIGMYGCAIASIAMLVNTLRHDSSVMPADVNEALLGVDAFGGPWGNFVIWDRVPVAFPDLRYHHRIICREKPATSMELEAVDSLLNAGIPVIVEVDMSRITPGYQQHFCLIVDGDADRYYINDPWPKPGPDNVPTLLCPKYGSEPKFAVCGAILYDRAASPGTCD